MFQYHIQNSPRSLKGELLLKIEGKDSPADASFLALLRQARIPFAPLIEIPPRYVNEVFKLLAASGELYYQNKKLLIDLYGKSVLQYRIKVGGRVLGEIVTSQKVIPLSEVTLIGQGDPHWFLHGMMIRFLETEIFWSDLAQIAYHPEKIQGQDLLIQGEEGPKVVFEENAKLRAEIEAKPLPLLRLHDRTGAFADLWMDYQQGEKGIVPAHDTALRPPKGVRDLKSEGEWEKDLLETGFQKKTVGRSHYYCPVDQVAKTLSFLLDLGWKLEDAQERVIVKQKGSSLAAETAENVIRLKGNVTFGDHVTDLAAVYGAFTRRDRFVELGSSHVGLLEGSTLPGLEDLEIEAIEKDALLVRKQDFASMQQLLDKGVLQSVDAPIAKLKELLYTLPEGARPNLPSDFKGTLRPYQQVGVDWLWRLRQLGLHGLLADDMGLGKTVQVIAFLSLQETFLQDKPTLIIVPTTLLFNWVKEFEKFLPSKRIRVHQGSSRIKDLEVLRSSEIIVTTYTTLRIDLPLFLQMDFSHVILDEAQAIKNDKTQIAQAVLSLRSDFRLSMTGTPIENRFGELWSHFRFLLPDLFGSLEQFESEAGIDPRRIKRKVRPFILRRHKSEVAADLPEKIEQVVWVEMGEAQRSLYERFLATVKGNLNKKSTIEVLEAILRLRQLCCHPLLLSGILDAQEMAESAKFNALFADLETLIAEEQKVLVYSQFTSMLALMIKEATARGWNFCVLDGSTRDRESQVSKFQNDKNVSIFFVSLKAGGAGLNLTAADAVLLYDPWWNEAVERQAIDRVHRIGRTSPVLAKRYIVQESVEEKMMKIKQSKVLLASDLLEEELGSLRLTAEELELLLS